VTFTELVDRLGEFYGPLAPPPPDPFGVYLWQVLGVKTTAGRRDAALQALRRIPAMTPDSVRKVGRGRLEAIARLCGPFADERVSAIEMGVDVFRRRRDLADRLRGPLRAAWLAVRDLPHLGDAGSLRLLLFASPHGLVPVDADLARLAVRLGLVETTTDGRHLARRVRRILGRQLPSEIASRRTAVLYLAHHAQATCVEVEPHCGICPILPGCAEGQARSNG
jgi:endonuclease III